MSRLRWVAMLATTAGALACGDDFTPKNAVRGVRILAAKADIPFARPGEDVRLEVLAHDGRARPPQASPMRVFWFPAPCIDPPGGQYYGCYPLFEALFPLGVDLSAAPTSPSPASPSPSPRSLIEGDVATIRIPDDALAEKGAGSGAEEPFATAYVFMVACAGRVVRVPRRSDLALNALPLGCVGDHDELLGGDDFVVGFTRVFVFASRRNAVPTVGAVLVDGRVIPEGERIVTRRCTNADSCDTVSFDLHAEGADAESDPDNVDLDGVVGRETIYVDWFTSIGQFDANRKILIDGHLGRPPKTTITFEPPAHAGAGMIWAVLHDNRGGTTWRAIPIEVQ